MFSEKDFSKQDYKRILKHFDNTGFLYDSVDEYIQANGMTKEEFIKDLFRGSDLANELRFYQIKNLSDLFNVVFKECVNSRYFSDEANYYRLVEGNNISAKKLMHRSNKKEVCYCYLNLVNFAIIPKRDGNYYLIAIDY